MVDGTGSESFRVDESVDGDRQCPRLLALLLPREQPPAYNLYSIAHFWDSRMLTDLVMRFLGGSAALSAWYNGLCVLIIVHATVTRSFKNITRTPY